jgi:hypothetical protein
VSRLLIPGILSQQVDPIRAIFSSANLRAYYDPSDSATVFQDAAMTTPAGADDPVGAIMDKSGNGNHALQSTTSFRPVRRLSGGLWHLEFDGLDDHLATSGAIVSISDGYFASTGTTIVGAAQAQSVFDADLSAGQGNRVAQLLRISGTADARTIAFDSGGAARPSFLENAFTRSQPFVLSAVGTTTSAQAFANNSAATAVTFTAPTSLTQRLFIGRRVGPITVSDLQHLSGRFFGGIFVNRAATSAERLATVAHWARKSGVTL